MTERARAAKWGIKDLKRKYTLMDMASGDVVFAATGVTDGSMLRRRAYDAGQYITTESVVMRSATAPCAGSRRAMSARAISRMRAEALAPAPAAAFGVARSFTGRRWRLRGAEDEAATALAREANISPALARLLVARGVAAADVDDYLNPTLKRFLPEPLTLKDMDKAVARTARALEKGEKIAILGDYDVDGSASAALLMDFLSALGASPRVYIPDRMTEGYGPNIDGLLKLKAEGVSLVVTVDCGAGAVAPLAAARDAGLDVVVLDHHAVEVPPPALAHVNPNQPGDTSGLGYVCAAGITFLFAVALNRALREGGSYDRKNIAEPDLRDFADLCRPRDGLRCGAA